MKMETKIINDDDNNQFIDCDIKTGASDDKEMSNEDSVFSICPQCPFSATSIQQLENHMDKCHSDSNNFIQGNNNVSPLFYDTNINLISATPAKSFTSSNSSQCSVSRSDDKLNINPINFVNSITAEVQSKLAMLKSNTLVSDSRRRYRCSICPVTFPWHGDLAAHLSETHGFRKSTRDGSKSKAGSYKCSFCMYVAKYQSELKRHRRLHMGVKPFGCVFCKYRSAWKGDLKRHIESHHRSSFNSEDELAAIMAQYKNNAGTDIRELNSLSTDTDDSMNKTLDTIITASPTSIATPSTTSITITPMEKPILTTYTQQPIQDTVLNLSISANNTNNKIINNNSDNNNNKNDDEKFIAITTEIESNVKHSNNILTNSIATQLFPNLITNMASGNPLNLPNLSDYSLPPFFPPTNLAQFPPPPPNMSFNDLMRGMFNSLLPGPPPPPSLISPLPPLHPPPPTNFEQHPINLTTASSNTNASSSPIIASGTTVTLPILKIPTTSNKTANITPNDSYNYSGPSSNNSMNISSNLNAISSSTPNTSNSAASNNTNNSHQEHWKRFKCSACGHRSNWKWDINKHIKVAHPERDGISTLELSFEEAKATLQTYLNSTKANKSRCHNSFESEEGYYRPYKCSSCGHRSNWKWDVNKHIKQVHQKQAEVITLSMEEAKRTICQYKRHRRSTSSLVQSTSPTSTSSTKTTNPSMVPPSLVFPNLSINSTSNFPFISPATESSSTNILNQSSDINSTVDIESIKCQETPSTTSTNSLNTNNPRIDSLRLKRLKCSACGYRSNYRSDISRHIRRKHEPNTANIEFLSDILSFNKAELNYEQQTTIKNTTKSNTTKINSTNNLINNNSRKLWQCNLCEFNAKEKIQVSHHITQEHHPQRPFKCKICNYGSDYRNSLLRHLRAKHKCSSLTPQTITELLEQNLSKIKSNNNNTLSKYSCHKCSQQYDENNPAAQKLLFEHYLNQHANSDEEMVLIINNISNNDDSNSSKPIDFQCPQCPFKTTYSQAVELHQFQHSELCQYLFKCTICSYKAGQERFLSNHLASHFNKVSLNSFQLSASSSTNLLPTSLSMSSSISSSSFPNTKSQTSFHCRRCQHFTTNIYHLRVHYQTRHNTYSTRRKLININSNNSTNKKRIGQEEFELNESTLNWYKSININDNKSINWCDECGFICFEESTFLCHLMNHFNNNNKIEQHIWYNCELCTFHCDTIDEINSHKTIHILNEITNLTSRLQTQNNSTNQYKCSLCQYKTDNSIKFRLHNQYHQINHNIHHHCYICQYTHPKIYGLIHHYRFHH